MRALAWTREAVAYAYVIIVLSSFNSIQVELDKRVGLRAARLQWALAAAGMIAAATMGAALARHASDRALIRFNADLGVRDIKVSACQDE